ncbi:hypothetical protein SAMN04487783_0815 [Agrococcus baldri]|uniref:Uncharacterized protein n=2 Tax=Agrococcus baldri TaxID=153730 RepID=A0AA94HLB0_9MICO|nr:hypothetical protein SAMN04487783_0815 [Agrococcus baldri]
MDPTWLAVIGVISALGAISSLVVLARQHAPRASIIPDRVARRREPGRAIAH